MMSLPVCCSLNNTPDVLASNSFKLVPVTASQVEIASDQDFDVIRVRVTDSNGTSINMTSANFKVQVTTSARNRCNRDTELSICNSFLESIWGACQVFPIFCKYALSCYADLHKLNACCSCKCLDLVRSCY